MNRSRVLVCEIMPNWAHSEYHQFECRNRSLAIVDANSGPVIVSDSVASAEVARAHESKMFVRTVEWPSS